VNRSDSYAGGERNNLQMRREKLLKISPIGRKGEEKKRCCRLLPGSLKEGGAAQLDRGMQGKTKDVLNGRFN